MPETILVARGVHHDLRPQLQHEAGTGGRRRAVVRRHHNIGLQFWVLPQQRGFDGAFNVACQQQPASASFDKQDTGAIIVVVATAVRMQDAEIDGIPLPVLACAATSMVC